MIYEYIKVVGGKVYHIQGTNDKESICGAYTGRIADKTHYLYNIRPHSKICPKCISKMLDLGLIIIELISAQDLPENTNKYYP